MPKPTVSVLKFSAVYILLLFISVDSFCQPDKKLHEIHPRWKKGEQRKVVTETSTKIFLKDSLFNTTSATATYNILVVDTIKNFTIRYSSDNDVMDMNISNSSTHAAVDSAVNFIMDIVQKISEKTRGFTYELLVDKKDGQAFKVKNSSAFLKEIQQATTSLLNDVAGKKGIPANKIDSVQQKIVAYFKTAEPKILETIINEYNYIMAPYGYSFPYDDSITQQAMVHDVNALSEFGDIEIPAVITISSKKGTNSLTIYSDTDYDKEYLLEQIKKKHENMRDVTPAEIFMSEKVVTVFSTINNWIVSHTSDVVFTMKDITVINKSMVTFK